MSDEVQGRHVKSEVVWWPHAKHGGSDIDSQRLQAPYKHLQHGVGSKAMPVRHMLQMHYCSTESAAPVPSKE